MNANSPKLRPLQSDATKCQQYESSSEAATKRVLQHPETASSPHAPTRVLSEGPAILRSHAEDEVASTATSANSQPP